MSCMKVLSRIILLNILMVFLFGGCTQVPDENNNGGNHSQKPKETASPTLKKKRAKTQIGIWYSVWYSNGSGNSANENFWNSENIYYKPLLPDGSYGRYDSLDDEIIQFHLHELTTAQIDFIIMDQTNDIDVAGGYINQRALKMAKSIMKWNDNKENDTVKIHNAAMSPEIDLILRNYTHTTYRKYPDLMARVLNVKKILEANSYPKEKGHFRVKVNDTLDFTQGVWEVEFENGTAVASRINDTTQYDLSADMPAFSQLVYGYDAYTIDTAAYMEGVKILNPNTDFFRAFSKKNNGLFEHF
jgi:hypothetical protein